MDPTLAFIQNIGPLQWLIILALGLLIFGRKLPEVGRSLGRAIVEFKKGIKGIDEDSEEASERGRAAAKPSLPDAENGPSSRRVSTADKVEENA